MNKKTFFIICCAFSLIIAVQSIIQVITHGAIDSTETIAYNFGHVTGIAIRILGSIVISFYFIRCFFENRRSLS